MSPRESRPAQHRADADHDQHRPRQLLGGVTPGTTPGSDIPSDAAPRQ